MRILFATDGSRGASIAEDLLLSLPLSCADEVTIVTSPTVSERESFALLARCRWRFAGRDIQATTVMRGGAPAQVAESVAIERASELIVVGSRGLGQWSGTLMGSVARSLARDGVAPVLVVRARRDAPRRVLVALDGSTEAHAAVELLAHLPLPLAARLALLRVSTADEGSRLADVVMERARAVLRDRIEGSTVADGGHLGEDVLRRALRSGSDLIVLGSGGQTRASGLLHASVADHVLSHAHCAVLVAKPPLRPRMLQAPVVAGTAPAY